ncbi:DUF6207 family protein [Streptomyces sp. NBC_00459]|uniref:DUF6207 family protein n=1 Tax=Streptomyces sp. NBC_00459 TaxID=2975749 RepID=UPI002E173587
MVQFFRPYGAAAGFGEIRCGRWASAKADHPTRDAGQPGVRLHCLDVRRNLSAQPRRGVATRCPSPAAGAGG